MEERAVSQGGRLWPTRMCLQYGTHTSFATSLAGQHRYWFVDIDSDTKFAAWLAFFLPTTSSSACSKFARGMDATCMNHFPPVRCVGATV
eukprot:364556-Chlamydomonas_euryale.AAC.21